MIALSDVPQVRYRANLQRVGAMVPETIAVLQRFATTGNWNRTKSEALRDNLLMKRSLHTSGPMLTAIKQRYFQRESSLPNARDLGEFVSANLAVAAKSQALFPYICKSDPLVQSLILNLVIPATGGTRQLLTQDDVVLQMHKEAEKHGELGGWSEYLQRRWARGFLSLLRDFGFMEAAPSTKLLQPQLRVEPFCFFLLHLLDNGSTPIAAVSDSLWVLFGASSREKDELLREAQSKGWIRLLRAGDFLEYSSRYASFGEWLDDVGR